MLRQRLEAEHGHLLPCLRRVVHSFLGDILTPEVTNDENSTQKYTSPVEIHILLDIFCREPIYSVDSRLLLLDDGEGRRQLVAALRDRYFLQSYVFSYNSKAVYKKPQPLTKYTVVTTTVD